MYRPNMNKLCCLNILFYKFRGRYYQRSFVPRPIHMKNIFPWNIFPHFVFFYNLPTYFINETAGRCTVQSVLLLGRESIRENFCNFHTYFTLEEYCKKKCFPFWKVQSQLYLWGCPVISQSFNQSRNIHKQKSAYIIQKLPSISLYT